VSRSYLDEVLRINERYLTEVVEGLDLCPFAAGTRQSYALHRQVLLGSEPRLDLVQPALAAADAAGATIGLLIFPRWRLASIEFDRFVDALRTADSNAGARPVFAMASFHPEAPFEVDSPLKLVPLFRRAPDPTIQLVRFSSLEAVRSSAPGGKFLFDYSPEAFAQLVKRAAPSLSDQIAAQNHQTAMREGIEAILARQRAIKEDRDQSYAAFPELAEADVRAQHADNSRTH
jgi:hypothetical protein